MRTRALLLMTSSLWLLGLVMFTTYSLPIQAQANEIVTADSIDVTGATTPARIITKRIRQDGGMVETTSVEGPAINGGYAPLIETEQQTIPLSPNSTNVVRRRYARDSNGNRRLLAVTEEQRSTGPGGRESVVRTTSIADVNGTLQPMEREVQETEPTGENTQQTTRTISRQTANGFQSVERWQQTEQRKGNITEQQTTMLTRDANGNFSPFSATGSTTTRTATGQTSDKRFSWTSGLGAMTEIQREVTTESQEGQLTRGTTQTYSAYVPGSTPAAGSLVLVQQVSSSRQSVPVGSSQSEQQIQAIRLGNPTSGLQLVATVTEVSRPTAHGKTIRQVVRSSDVNGAFSVVWVTDTHETRVSP